MDLLSRSVNVVVVADGTSSQRAGDRAVALQWMAGAGATITTTESLMLMMCRSAEHAAFKPILSTLIAHNKHRNRLLEEGLGVGGGSGGVPPVRLA